MNSSIKIANTMGSREDRISSLPDSILIHILSFLPTKFAVRTSILSTRWRYTWTSIPVLDFCDRLYSWIEPNARDKSHFMNFVERVLLFHHGSNVHKFSLECSITDLFRVHSWISSTIIKHRVEELKLKIFNSGTSSFPLSPGFFSCKSLIKLTIQVQRVVIPSSVCMSSLKSLIFCNTVFSCEGLAPPVYFRFPNLDNFSVEYCEWENIESVYVFVPKLKRLSIYEDSLELEEVGIPVNFYAENLKSFEFSGVRFNKYPVCNLSSVINASIDVSRDNNIDALGVNSFLGRFFNVKDLTVACQVINTLSHADNLSHLLKFPNLTNLKLTSLYNFSSEDLLRFLHMLPNLESLLFTDELDAFIYNEDDPIHNTVPQCFVTHLKAIEFPFLLGNESELFLIKLLLKKVQVLERMTIKSSFELLNDVKMQMEITKNLLMLPRASACVISFS